MHSRNDLPEDLNGRLIDSLPALVMVSDATGAVQFFNERWYSFTGQRDLTEPWTNALHPADAIRVETEWKRAVRLKHRTIPMEYRLRHAASGQYRWFSARATAIAGEHGEVVQWIGVAVDVHDRKAAETGLAQLYYEEHGVAEAFQRAALPPALPQVAGCSFDAAYVPSTGGMLVGGDWYDAFVTTGGSIVLTVGDVSGHSLRSAIVMSTVRQTIRALALHHDAAAPFSPSAILDSVERIVAFEQPDEITTVFLGVVNPQLSQLVYGSAGHPYPVWIDALGQTHEAATDSGTPLGCKFDVPRRDATLDLSGVDLLFVYTDGLTDGGPDAPDRAPLLRELLTARRAKPIGGMCAAIAQTIAGQHARDDVAALAIAFGR